MQTETKPISPARKKREALAGQYGSYENYLSKLSLVARYADEEKAFKAKVEAHPKITKDTMSELLDGMVPYWMNPFLLRSLNLALIGSPELSNEWKQDSGNVSARSLRLAGVTYQDYSDLGWPRTAGAAVRKVTPEEHGEILRRLKSAGLTKPGAEVATVGKTLAQMIEEDRPVPGWIIEGVLRWGGAAMVYGPSGIGKTWLTHTLMLLAAAGEGAGVYNEQVDRWTLKAGDHRGAKVCLLDGEMITADITARAKVLCEALGLRMTGSVQGVEPMDYAQLRLAMLASGDDLAEVDAIVQGLASTDAEKCLRLEGFGGGEGPCVDLSRIVVYPKADQDHRAEFVDLADAAWKHRIVEFCKAQGIKVLILDNLATLSESLEDENSAANWNPLNSLVVALKKEGVATIVVHHANKGNQGYRGSSNLATTLETIVRLEPLKGAEASDGAAFKITFEKSRAHGQPEADGKSLRLKEGRWVSEVDPLDQTLTVVAMAKSLRYKKQSEIGAKLGVDQATICRIFKAAEAQGLAEPGELSGYLRQARDLARDLALPVEPEADYEAEEEIDL